MMLLWDFDGTLADTLLCSVAVFNRLAQKHGLRPIENPEIVRHMDGMALLKRQGVSLLQVPFLLRSALAHLREEMASIRLMPGIADLLTELTGAGLHMRILSSNRPDNIQSCLQANGIAERFDAIEGQSRLFGKARGIRNILRSQHLSPLHVVYIGDEVRDIEAAREAGVKSVAVTWGFQSREVLHAAAPDHLIDHPAELLGILRQISAG